MALDLDVTAKLYDPQLQDARTHGGEAKPRASLIVLSGPLLGETYPLSDGPVLLGRSSEARVQILAEGISRMHALFIEEADGWVVEDLRSKNGTRLNGELIHRAGLKDGDKILIGASTVLKFVYQDPLEERFLKQMYESALRDGLTKVFNKRYFMDRLRSEVAYAARHGSPLSLLILDVDHFKQVNDAHGHPAGDLALCAIAEAVGRTIRREDVLARYGGEEFSVLCRGVALPGAQTFAERVRSTVAAIRLVEPKTRAPIPLTVSVGVAQLGKDAKAVVDAKGGARLAESLIALADQALYAAKQAGRNCVRVAARPTY